MDTSGNKKRLHVSLLGSFSSFWFVFLLLILNSLNLNLDVSIITLIFLFFVLYSRQSIPRGLLKYLLIPLILVCLGMINSFGHIPYNIFKDFWYFINPGIALTLGYVMVYKTERMKQILMAFVFAGFVFSLIYIYNFFANPLISIHSSVNVIRKTIGPGNFLFIISIFIIIYCLRAQIFMFQKRELQIIIIIILIVNFGSLILSFSRTLWMSFFIFAIGITGIFSFKKLGNILIVFALAIVLMFSSLLLVPKSMSEKCDCGSVKGKVEHLIKEVIPSNYDTQADINNNWRGYESYRALKTYSKGNTSNILFGHGFGKLIDLGLRIKLGNKKFRFIPILHNGYLYVLVKTGIIGILFFCIYLFIFYWTGILYIGTGDLHLKFTGNFIISLLLVLTAATFVVSGYFSKELSFQMFLLLGAMLGYGKNRQLYLKSERKSGQESKVKQCYE